MANDDMKAISQLLQSLLIIELWRGGLSQGEISKRLNVATVTVNKILKGVNREILTKDNEKK